MNSVVRFDGVVKTYGRLRALDGFDLEVRPGEIHGFCGPNGAGKSTALRILLGLARHDSGVVQLFGSDPWREAVPLHARLAYVPGDVGLWPGLTGGQALDILTRLGGGHSPRRRDELLERFALDPTKKARTYSKGNRQKVALIAAFAADVELLILDEPTSGLDPLMEDVFRDEVRRAAERGTTVLLSSHILTEVEELCGRVTIIRDGRTVRSSTLAEIQSLTRTAIEARTREPVALDPALGAELSNAGRHLRVEAPTAELDTVLTQVLAAGVEQLSARPPSLEQIFLEHYEVDAR
ncbi:ABC transporter ATP-binding protein [Actinomyces slackii]|uniref:Daunorubicin/doxorubicin resistance ATP-binding protein DrrA n=1 Tax=Actinomyces slackii TaxID=52774 RepID=A0A3S4TBC6_9ACTO|nr:ABC transporter ATP-binding protein [Actinomyces slackii]VEG74005.1 Daunorubicin/doxorubicin resistance ATP-binding protein DrrA [Actinomyces slackii]